MPADDAALLRTPRDVNEAREILSAVWEVPPNELARHWEMEDDAFDRILAAAIAGTSRGTPFLAGVTKELLAKRGREGQPSLKERIAQRSRQRGADVAEQLSKIRAPVRSTEEEAFSRARDSTRAMPVADQTNDVAALRHQVNELKSRVNWVLGVAGTLLIGGLAGAIGLWQAIGNVETRLTRELGQAETRIIQQIADVRSEVGEIRGRLSVMGQPGPTPPQR